HLHPPLRSPLLPLPPRRTPAYRPAPHLQRTRQDPLGLCPPRTPPRGPLMAGRTPPPQATAPRDPPTDRRPAPCPGAVAETQGRATLIAGRALVQTVRHFFPDFNGWLDRLPDTRCQDACTYDRRFLAWWGLQLYLLQLGSRRQLDFELRD